MIPPIATPDGRPVGNSSPASKPGPDPAGNTNGDSAPLAKRSPGSPGTDVKVDEHHRIYYEVVDARTGSVLFEIPAEALRKIAESLNIPLDGSTSSRRLDVKS